MSIDVVNKTSGSAAGSTSNNTASVSRTAGRVYLICVGSTRNASTTPVEPTISGTGITQLASVTLLVTATGTNRRRLTIILALATSTGSNVMTINHSSAPTRVAWIVDEAADVDTTTPRVASNDQTDAGSATADVFQENITMDDHVNAGDRYYSCVFGNVNAATIRGELDADKGGTTNSVDWEDLGTASNSSAPVMRISSFWNDESVRKDLSPGWVSDTTITMGQIAIELSQAIAARLPYWGISAH